MKNANHWINQLAWLGLALLLTGSLRAELISNGGFESGTGGWILSGGASRYQTVSTAHTGNSALRVFNRISFTNAPQQDVTAAFSAATNGTTWTTRLAVQVAFPTTVRIWLRVAADNGGQLITNRHLLAGQVVRDTNGWTSISGTKKVSWNGTLLEALFYTESGMRQESPGNAYPATVFDSISSRPDTDGDGLWDDEEVAVAQGGTGTDWLLADTDADGLPDGWEFSQGTNPLVPDAGADADLDGATNWQEYWAATQPTNSVSFPGRTRVDGLTADTRAVLRYLALLPAGSTNRCLVGQHLSDIDKEWTNHVVKLHTQTGQWPGVVSLAAESGTGPLQMNSVTPRALEAWTNGSLVVIKWAMQNPWNGLMAGATNASGVNIPELLNPATPLATNQTARANYLAWRTTVADHLTTLRDAGVVVLFRPCSEVNGAWFWWGNKPRDHYLALWRDLHDHYTFERGLTNLLWVYEPDSLAHLVNSPTSSGTPIDYYYPGDDVTDVVGHNFYDDDWALGFDSDAVWRSYGKPFAVPQAGPNAKRDGTFDNLTYLNGVTNTIPRISFFCVWNSFVTGGGTTTNHIGITDNLNPTSLATHPMLVSRERIDWQYHLDDMRVDFAPQPGGLLEFKWQGGLLQESTDLVNWTDVSHATRPRMVDPSVSSQLYIRVRK